MSWEKNASVDNQMYYYMRDLPAGYSQKANIGLFNCPRRD